MITKKTKSLLKAQALAILILAGLWIFNAPVDSYDKVYENAVAPHELQETFRFEEVSEQLGVHYQHAWTDKNKRGLSPYNIVSPTPSVSIVDINGDGFPDIYLPTSVIGASSMLYINQTGKTFTDQAARFGIADAASENARAMGIWLDYNRDGFPDLVQTKYGCHLLYQGQGPNRPMKLIPGGFSGYCSLPEGVNALDFNRDGQLDLVFGNFLPRPDEGKGEELWMSAPRQDNKTGGANHLLVQKNGVFVVERGVNFKTRSYTHSVGISDINGDGWPDIAFSNDYSYDELFLNQAGKTVVDKTNEYLPKKSHGMSGMNTEFADFNNDGRMDLYITNIHKPPFYRKYNLLWEQQSNGRFVNTSLEKNVARCGFSWGAKFADFNNDGELDLFVVNGRVKDKAIQKPGEGSSLWYRRIVAGEIPEVLKRFYWRRGEGLENTYISAFERSCLFAQKDGKFFDVAVPAGVDDRQEGRGVALLDFNNDGLMDVVTVSLLGRVKLYKNISTNKNHWVGFDLIDKWNSRIAIGAKVKLKLPSGKQFIREIYPANGYQSQSDPRLLFGLGKAPPASLRLEVRWPDDTLDIYEDLKIDSYNEIRQSIAPAQGTKVGMNEMVSHP